MKDTNRIPYVFLTSHAFSGSTLSSFLLGAHPQIATVGMLTGPASHLDLAKYECSCGQLFQADPFWQAVTAVLHRLGLPYQLDQYFDTRFDLGRTALSRRLRSQSLRSNRLEQWRDKVLGALWPGHRQELLARVRRNELFARAILEVTGKPIFLDTSKDPLRIRYLQLSPHIDLYVIHLVRDVRGVVASIMSRKPEVTAEQATKHWLRAEQNIRRLRQEVASERQIEVRYEEIAGNTLPTLNRLFTFVGAHPLVDLSDFRETDHHVLGNKMRKNSSSEIRLDERWRTVLSPEEVQKINRLAKA
jgi:hypothetical protein